MGDRKSQSPARGHGACLSSHASLERSKKKSAIAGASFVSVAKPEAAQQSGSRLPHE